MIENWMLIIEEKKSSIPVVPTPITTQSYRIQIGLELTDFCSFDQLWVSCNVIISHKFDYLSIYHVVPI